MQLLNRGGVANPDVLLVPHPDGAPLVVKDYATCSLPVRLLLAPFLVRHELAMLRRVEGLPGVPGPRGRIDRLALAMEHIEGIPLRRKSHRASLPRAFFDALEGILEGLNLRGVAYFDLRSPTNVLSTRATGGPALVDLASGLRLPLPRSWTRAIERSALAKLRTRFERVHDGEPAEPVSLDYRELHLGRSRVCFLDRGRLEDPVPALFLHDVGHSCEVFRPLLESAHAHARRGIGLDLPGFGRSSLRVLSLSPQRVARHVAGLVDALRLERIDLVGFGWGGLVARVLAARRPRGVRALLTFETPLTQAGASLGQCIEEGRRNPELLRRRLLRELPAGLAEAQRSVLEDALKNASARALRWAYAGIRVKSGPPGPNGELELADMPQPRQPWLRVRTDQGEPHEPREIAGGSPHMARWSEPLADPARLWNALERLSKDAC